MDDDCVLLFTEENERNWREYLAEFKESVFPIFEPYGFTFPQAFTVWTMNRVNNNVGVVADHFSA